MSTTTTTRTTTVTVTVTLTLDWDEDALDDAGTKPDDYRTEIGDCGKTAKDAILDQLIEDNGLPVIVKHQSSSVRWDQL